MKKVIVTFGSIVLCFLVSCGGVLTYLSLSSRPPQEAELIQNFYSHQAAFERLRDMLQDDSGLIRLGGWGVATTDSVVPRIPPEGKFPSDRYDEYRDLLEQVGGTVASRREGKPANPSILIWGWGFAGETRHVGICWMEEEPANQIPTLDGYQGRGGFGDRIVVYRHVETNWYLWTDLPKH